jgi:hypothetical protein
LFNYIHYTRQVKQKNITRKNILPENIYEISKPKNGKTTKVDVKWLRYQKY